MVGDQEYDLEPFRMSVYSCFSEKQDSLETSGTSSTVDSWTWSTANNLFSGKKIKIFFFPNCVQYFFQNEMR